MLLPSLLCDDFYNKGVRETKSLALYLLRTPQNWLHPPPAHVSYRNRTANMTCFDQTLPSSALWVALNNSAIWKVSGRKDLREGRAAFLQPDRRGTRKVFFSWGSRAGMFPSQSIKAEKQQVFLLSQGISKAGKAAGFQRACARLSTSSLRPLPLPARPQHHALVLGGGCGVARLHLSWGHGGGRVLGTSTARNASRGERRRHAGGFLPGELSIKRSPASTNQSYPNSSSPG